jgi:hypothetical protein
MTADGRLPRPERRLAIAAVAAMASGTVVAIGDLASLPLVIVIGAATVFIGSIVAFGAITYGDARSSGSTFGSALARSLRTAGKMLVALTP